MNRLALSLQPLLELLRVEDPQNLTDEEIVRFRKWLQAAYEQAGAEIEEPEPSPPAAPVAPAPVKTKPTHPNPEAVAALYARLDWFFARRAMEQERAEAEKEQA